MRRTESRYAYSSGSRKPTGTHTTPLLLSGSEWGVGTASASPNGSALEQHQTQRKISTFTPGITNHPSALRGSGKYNAILKKRRQETRVSHKGRNGVKRAPDLSLLAAELKAARNDRRGSRFLTKSATASAVLLPQHGPRLVTASLCSTLDPFEYS
jgi:hypothetical protein